MDPIRVVVHGASGKMGQEVVRAVYSDPALRLVGGVDAVGTQPTLSLPDGSGAVPFSSSLEQILTACRPDVMVDFTVAKASLPAARTAAAHGVNLVIGTTGLSAADIEEIRRVVAENKVGAVVAANFALGGVLMMHLAKIAAKYFDYADIIELHHHKKIDAPSGTALTTAMAMAQTRGKPFLKAPGEGDRTSCGLNVEGIAVHSVRLPGLMAHQEVLLGTSGQTLSIRHDTISRECYMPGVLMAIKEVVNRKGLTYGLDALLGL